MGYIIARGGYRLSMLVLHTPAKINWCLYVLNKRDDGFHNILSLMQCIGLYDTLTFEPSETIEVKTLLDIPVRENIIFRAAEMLREYSGAKGGARIDLLKEIPMGAGLGGGSSDAACALRGLNSLWGLGVKDEELERMAAHLGSDVPFFFHCPLAVAEGRGEKMSPLSIEIPYTILLVKPDLSVSTAWAYGELSRQRAAKQRGAFVHPANGEGLRGGNELTKDAKKLNNINLIYNSFAAGNISAHTPIFHNDLEDIAKKRYPIIGTLKQKLLESGALVAMMTGSGSAVFGLFQDKGSAIKASDVFSHYWHRVVDTLCGNTGRQV